MPTLMDLLEAGVHFGHKKERSNPKMKDYTFSLREGVFIIDLDKTKDLLEGALKFLKQEIEAGKIVLFVGTKRQAKDVIKSTAEAAGMPYINHRWLGGTLTNYETVRRSITEMERLENQIVAPEFAAITKKERKLMTDRLEKLRSVFGGVKDMKKLPDLLFVIDAHHEQLAIDEASRIGIPVIAIADTDANPEKIGHIIPANDDAAKSIDLIMKEVNEIVGVKKQVKTEKKSEEKETKKADKEDK
ncbi:MAG: 30S ribosomal protein S2 [Candidatus Berkelbacteria bacterium]